MSTSKSMNKRGIAIHGSRCGQFPDGTFGWVAVDIAGTPVGPVHGGFSSFGEAQRASEVTLWGPEAAGTLRYCAPGNAASVPS